MQLGMLRELVKAYNKSLGWFGKKGERIAILENFLKSKKADDNSLEVSWSTFIDYVIANGDSNLFIPEYFEGTDDSLHVFAPFYKLDPATLTLAKKRAMGEALRSTKSQFQTIQASITKAIDTAKEQASHLISQLEITVKAKTEARQKLEGLDGEQRAIAEQNQLRKEALRTATTLFIDAGKLATTMPEPVEALKEILLSFSTEQNQAVEMGNNIIEKNKREQQSIPNSLTKTELQIKRLTSELETIQKQLAESINHSLAEFRAKRTEFLVAFPEAADEVKIDPGLVSIQKKLTDFINDARTQLKFINTTAEREFAEQAAAIRANAHQRAVELENLQMQLTAFINDKTAELDAIKATAEKIAAEQQAKPKADEVVANAASSEKRSDTITAPASAYLNTAFKRTGNALSFTGQTLASWLEVPPATSTAKIADTHPAASAASLTPADASLPSEAPRSPELPSTPATNDHLVEKTSSTTPNKPADNGSTSLLDRARKELAAIEKAVTSFKPTQPSVAAPTAPTTARSSLSLPNLFSTVPWGRKPRSDSNPTVATADTSAASPEAVAHTEPASVAANHEELPSAANVAATHAVSPSSVESIPTPEANSAANDELVKSILEELINRTIANAAATTQVAITANSDSSLTTAAELVVPEESMPTLEEDKSEIQTNSALAPADALVEAAAPSIPTEEVAADTHSAALIPVTLVVKEPELDLAPVRVELTSAAVSPVTTEPAQTSEAAPAESTVTAGQIAEADSIPPTHDDSLVPSATGAGEGYPTDLPSLFFITAKTPAAHEMTSYYDALTAIGISAAALDQLTALNTREKGIVGEHDFKILYERIMTLSIIEQAKTFNVLQLSSLLAKTKLMKWIVDEYEKGLAGPFKNEKQRKLLQGPHSPLILAAYSGSVEALKLATQWGETKRGNLSFNNPSALLQAALQSGSKAVYEKVRALPPVAAAFEKAELPTVACVDAAIRSGSIEFQTIAYAWSSLTPSMTLILEAVPVSTPEQLNYLLNWLNRDGSYSALNTRGFLKVLLKKALNSSPENIQVVFEWLNHAPEAKLDLYAVMDVFINDIHLISGETAKYFVKMLHNPPLISSPLEVLHQAILHKNTETLDLLKTWLDSLDHKYDFKKALSCAAEIGDIELMQKIKEWGAISDCYVLARAIISGNQTAIITALDWLPAGNIIPLYNECAPSLQATLDHNKTRLITYCGKIKAAEFLAIDWSTVKRTPDSALSLLDEWRAAEREQSARAAASAAVEELEMEEAAPEASSPRP